jgi:hypothetical protein
MDFAFDDRKLLHPGVHDASMNGKLFNPTNGGCNGNHQGTVDT